MKNGRNIINNSKIIIYILLFGYIMISCSSNREKRFEQDIKIGIYYWDDILLPILIYTSNEPLRLVIGSRISLVKEISKCHEINVDDAGVILYNSITRNLPIYVSKEYYHSSLNDCIKVDSVANSIYRKSGFQGILDNYCKPSGKLLTFEGLSTNELSYITYLLSLHDIYVVYFEGFEDHTLLYFIANEISNLP